MDPSSHTLEAFVLYAKVKKSCSAEEGVNGTSMPRSLVCLVLLTMLRDPPLRDLSQCKERQSSFTP